MPILATGSSLAALVSFNAGQLDINGIEFATVQDISVDLSVSTKDLRQLGSIIMVTAPKRYGYKPTAKGKIATLNKEFYGAFLGSSAVDGSGYDFTMFDGQNVVSRASIKVMLNDNPATIVEFQYLNAIIAGSFAAALKTESFAELSFEIQSQDCKVVTNF